MKNVLLPEGWPRPRGYANGVSAQGRQVFVAGMVGWNADARFESDDLVDQVRQALVNVRSVLAQGLARPEHMVRMTWYLVDRREIRKLKRGDYTVDGRLDLHGRTAAEACPDVRRFVEQSRHSRHRCVCIVHGRGLHSEGSASILKPRVRACLKSLQSVLAFSDAPRSEGGAGAVYVLLRR